MQSLLLCRFWLFAGYATWVTGVTPVAGAPSAIPSTQRLYLTISLDVRRVNFANVLRLINLKTTPFFRLVGNKLVGVNNYNTVEGHVFRIKFGQVQPVFSALFTTSVTSVQRVGVAQVVLGIERARYITVDGVVYPIIGYIGIFDTLEQTSNNTDAIDWCSSPAIFRCRPGSTCKDEGLRYTCPCSVGYQENGTECVKLIAVNFTMTFGVRVVDVDYNSKTSPGYIALENEVKQVFTKIFSGADGVVKTVVNSLSQGSVRASASTVLLDTPSSKSNVIQALVVASRTTVTLSGQSVIPVVVISSNSTNYTLNPLSNKCEIYETLYGNCPSGTVCQLTGETASCVCISGFVRNPPPDQSCSDINECENRTSICDQICNNTAGSFECRCNPGYILSADGKTCKVNGGWSSWGPWLACSTTCGAGTQTRTRTCNNPAPANGGQDCPGNSTETKNCMTQLCMCADTPTYQDHCQLVQECCSRWKCPPINGGWSDWSSWQTCSTTCGGGTQTRTRTCTNPVPANGGLNCLGSYTETQNCNNNTSAVDGNWSEWVDGPCTGPCGCKIQVRTRTCTNPAPASCGRGCPGIDSETQECNPQECSETYKNWWASWSQCMINVHGACEKRRYCNGVLETLPCNDIYCENKPIP